MANTAVRIEIEAPEGVTTATALDAAREAARFIQNAGFGATTRPTVQTASVVSHSPSDTTAVYSEAFGDSFLREVTPTAVSGNDKVTVNWTDPVAPTGASLVAVVSILRKSSDDSLVARGVVAAGVQTVDITVSSTPDTYYAKTFGIFVRNLTNKSNAVLTT